ncbi:MAG: Ni/Fe-hydrogenase 1 b-type cytochrome subunit [Hyphomonas sp.]|uniref:cytochrome b/b6 domain-containing protein n=1 Tax=Hyphomonas sp. TaxID=87 RepID=UPI0017F18941|nr:cytochrome b/b6 domain-containing protein [Hyphomonas sp.]MBU3922130.1 cytochrome b/b6 domain-containing protein [Alphaproteobacteria bacterium]MBA3067601.1 Ni/Fe-hydrogenase 1 b-type cytochrome subunit [Hyphomonas sp.]MBU4063491.1 cytochrome b/b6 domain-containing protein [Alphaproteobacteria bacterium]MBU4165312.1 cytochrome b/b6 domain-containing protein [Alphaproteobacteria bacterium]MBU4568224.1 cytochrome b/b6 domain-containing protein [Alphaproteobacteria bacterium]
MTTEDTGHAPRKLRVWDLPTRLFHWSLLVLVLVSWFSGGEEDTAFIHRLSGMLLAGLIVFRVLWGFVGGEHARFAAFFPNPRAIIAHIKNTAAGRPDRHLGHNPVGGVAVFLLLASVSACVITGLFSSGEGLSGPFVSKFGLDMSEIHELTFRALQALVALHLLGVVFETWRSKDPLVPAMITGRKTRRPDEPGRDAKPGSAPALVIALLIGAATTAGLWALPAPAPTEDGEQASERGGEEEHDEDRERDRD